MIYKTDMFDLLLALAYLATVPVKNRNSPNKCNQSDTQQASTKAVNLCFNTQPRAESAPSCRASYLVGRAVQAGGEVAYAR